MTGHDGTGAGPPCLFAWRDAILTSDLPATTRHVLLTLSTHMNRDGGSAFPSTRTLAQETGLSRRTVEGHLRAAEAKGWIARSEAGAGRGWRRQEYEPLLPTASAGGAEDSPPKAGRGESKRTDVGKGVPHRSSIKASSKTPGGGGEEGGEGGSPPPEWPPPSELKRDGAGHLEYPDGYERLWSRYPRTDVGKKAGYRKVRRLRNEGVPLNPLIRAAEAYADRMQGEGREVEKIKHASTFFGPDDWWREELDREDGGPPEETSPDRRAALDAIDGGAR